MKMTKKILSLLLAVAMLFTCAYSAFALDVAEDAVADDATYNYKPADVDNDGDVTASDARSILRLSVGLMNWNQIAMYCKNAAHYNYRHAADVDYDGEITAADARIALRVSVELEKVAYEDNIVLTTKEQILDFYDRAINAVLVDGAAGFTKTAWQNMTNSDCTLFPVADESIEFSTCICGEHTTTIDTMEIYDDNEKLVDYINGFLVNEDEAKGIAYGSGTPLSKLAFPASTIEDYTRVASAACTVNKSGNLIITIVMDDVNTTVATKVPTYLDRFAAQQFNFADFDALLFNCPLIEATEGESVNNENFTIVAELTSKGEFVSLTQEADVVISADEIKVRQSFGAPAMENTTLENRSISFSTTTSFTNFNYVKSTGIASVNVLMTARQMIDLFKNSVNEVAYNGLGYTVTKEQSYEKKNADLACLINMQVENYFNNSSATYDKGSKEAIFNFPAFNNFVYTDIVDSVTCIVDRSGNHYISLDMIDDVDSTWSAKANAFAPVTVDMVHYDTDIIPALQTMNNVLKYDLNGTVTYNDFEITAEISPDGKLVAYTNSAVVTAYTPSATVLVGMRAVDCADQTLVLYVDEYYTNFVY